MGKNINNIKKTTDTLIDTNKVVGLKINRDRTKYMFMSHHQNAGQVII